MSSDEDSQTGSGTLSYDVDDFSPDKPMPLKKIRVERARSKLDRRRAKKQLRKSRVSPQTFEMQEIKPKHKPTIEKLRESWR